jgi:LCP family protein required for cell wall assembly
MAVLPSVSERLRLLVRALFAAVAFVVLVASGYAWATYQNFAASVPHGAAVPPLAEGAKDLDGSAQNILLIGNDTRLGATRAEQSALHTGHDDGTVNTDTMMILHLPADGSKPSIISFPRDSWVRIPGHGKAKLNSAYGDGYYPAIDRHASELQAESDGIISTLKTLSALTGLHIDHYMQVNLLGFYRISNAIGGVTICLKHAQNATTDKDAYGSGYSGINLPAGISTIKGEQALAFVRQRHGLPHGDLDRIRRQQYFLSAAFSKISSAGELLNPFKLHDLLTAVSSSLLTDPTLNLLSLAQSFELLSGGDITFQTLPNNGSQLIYPDGVETAIVGVDYPAIPGFIRSIIGQPADPLLAAAKPAPASSVTVDVLNGTDVYKLATRNSLQLKKLGFRIDVVDSTPAPVTTTTVLYPPAHQAGAKAVAAAVPGAKLVMSSSVARVTLELGSDGAQVRGLTAPQPRTSAPAPAAHAKPAVPCID